MKIKKLRDIEMEVPRLLELGSEASVDAKFLQQLAGITNLTTILVEKMSLLDQEMYPLPELRSLLKKAGGWREKEIFDG